MALPAKPTLGELRAEVLSRLGFQSQGASAGNIITTVDSFLRRAQIYLYTQHNFEELRVTYDYTTGVGQILYDYQSDMDPLRIVKVQTEYNDIWVDLHEGIEFYHDTVVETRYYPRRYDRRAQIEIWPEPDAEYLLRIEYYKTLSRFTQENDRCTINDHLLFTKALADAKAHYSQDDASVYYDELNSHLKKIRKLNIGNKRFIIGKEIADPLPKPRVIDYSS